MGGNLLFVKCVGKSFPKVAIFHGIAWCIRKKNPLSAKIVTKYIKFLSICQKKNKLVID